MIITRLDKIRAMSDDELAWVFMEFRVDAFGKALGDKAALPDSQKTIMDWLNEVVSPNEEQCVQLDSMED